MTKLLVSILLTLFTVWLLIYLLSIIPIPM